MTAADEDSATVKKVVAVQVTHAKNRPKAKRRVVKNAKDDLQKNRDGYHSSKPQVVVAAGAMVVVRADESGLLQPTAEEVADMKVAELRKHLQLRGVAVSGNKSALASRLVEHLDRPARVVVVLKNRKCCRIDTGCLCVRAFAPTRIAPLL